jgi:hypothetical protein
MGFHNYQTEPDIWMRKQGNLYEYIGVYVDDLAIAAVDPDNILKTMQHTYKIDFKGVGL